MYLLLAAIVLLLMFAASYGGRRVTVALVSTGLSAILMAGGVFVITARSAGPYLDGLAERLPPSSSQTVRDLGMAANHVSDSLALAPKSAAAPQAATADAAPFDKPANTEQSTAAWLTGDWLNGDWLDINVGSFNTAWLDPRTWFGEETSDWPEIDMVVRPENEREANPSGPQGARTMQPDVMVLSPKRATAAPGLKIVVAPPVPPTAPVTAPIPAKSDAPVKWFPDAPPPKDEEMILLTGANVSSMPLEDIQATLKPDSHDTAGGINGLALSVRIEGQDDTALDPGSAGRVVPPGARFYLQAANLSEADAKQLGGAIVSFAYSQAGRRRTSILYLKQTAFAGGAATTQ